MERSRRYTEGRHSEGRHRSPRSGFLRATSKREYAMTDAIDLRRFAGTLAAALAVVGLASCASGQRPDTGGVEPARYLARFSGEWALDRNVSADPARALEAHSRQGGHDRAWGGGAGGHGPGRHGGGGFPGGGPSDPAALEATFDVFRAVPDRFTLTVTDSLVVTTWAGEREARIPVAGDAIPISGRRRPWIEAKARWDGRKLRIERRIDGGGTIVDLVEAIPEGNRLLMTRTVKGVPGAIPEIRLAFDRAE